MRKIILGVVFCSISLSEVLSSAAPTDELGHPEERIHVSQPITVDLQLPAGATPEQITAFLDIKREELALQREILEAQRKANELKEAEIAQGKQQAEEEARAHREIEEQQRREAALAAEQLRISQERERVRQNKVSELASLKKKVASLETKLRTHRYKNDNLAGNFRSREMDNDKRILEIDRQKVAKLELELAHL